MRTPIGLITGPLGCGKTTLVRNLLEGMGERLAVIVNEFGEIAIDSKIIEGENVRIVELAGGCVCCSLAGEFKAAVEEILGRYGPEMVLVEATGVAEADALVLEVEESLPELRLDSVIYVVDAHLSTLYPQMGYAARKQLEAADIILINKSDLVTDAEAFEVENQVRKFSRTAGCIRTVRCRVDPALLFGWSGRERARPSGGGGAASFESFSFTSDRRMDREAFVAMMEDLPPSIWRAKGFVRFADGEFLFNYVVGRMELEEHGTEQTRLVFIGRRVEQERDSVVERLRRCEV
ncbi:MAG: GTP-binding protein [bacterium]